MTEVRKPGDDQFLEHLPDVEEFFGARAKLRLDVELSDIRPRHKSQRGPEVCSDLLPIDADLPEIIRIANTKAE